MSDVNGRTTEKSSEDGTPAVGGRRETVGNAGLLQIFGLALNLGFGVVLVNVAAYVMVTAQASVWGIPYRYVEVYLYVLMSPLVFLIILPTIVLGPLLFALSMWDVVPEFASLVRSNKTLRTVLLAVAAVVFLATLLLGLVSETWRPLGQFAIAVGFYTVLFIAYLGASWFFGRSFVRRAARSLEEIVARQSESPQRETTRSEKWRSTTQKVLTNVVAFSLVAIFMLFVLVWIGNWQEARRTEFWVPAGDRSAVVLQIHGEKAFLACRLSDGSSVSGLTMEDLSEVTPLVRQDLGRLKMNDAGGDVLGPADPKSRWCTGT